MEKESHEKSEKAKWECYFDHWHAGSAFFLRITWGMKMAEMLMNWFKIQYEAKMLIELFLDMSCQKWSRRLDPPEVEYF